MSHAAQFFIITRNSHCPERFVGLTRASVMDDLNDFKE